MPLIPLPDEWTDWPAAPGFKRSREYFWRIQLELALRYRFWARGILHYPRTETPWEEGTITAASATEITDDTKDWQLPADGPGCTHTGKRWYNYNSTCESYLPTFYDVIIDDPDPRKVIRAHITDVLASGTGNLDTVQVEDITDQIAFAAIDSIDELVGKKYYIIGRNHLWWHEGWLLWPNDWVYTSGTVTGGTTSTLVDSTKKWDEDRFVLSSSNDWSSRDLGDPDDTENSGGYVVIFFDAGTPGHWRRADITGNTSTTISFSATDNSPMVGAEYVVIKKNGRWEPGRATARPFTHYEGILESCWSHNIQDALTTTSLPAATLTWQKYNPLTEECEPETIVAFKVDVKTAIDDICNPPDHYYSPQFWVPIPQKQQMIEFECLHWLPVRDYEAYPLRFLHNHRFPTLMYWAGWNATKTTITGVSTSGIEVDLSDFLPVSPMPVQYTVIAADGSVKASGTADATTTEIEAGGGDETYDGLTIYVTLGWPRSYARRFGRMFNKTIFVADYEVIEDALVIYDPPTEAPYEDDETETPQNHVGRYITLPKSTRYKEFAEDGRATEGSEFVLDQVARYTGDNFNDPTTTDKFEGSAPGRPGGQHPETFYRDKGFVGVRHPEEFRQMRGRATSGSAQSLFDTTKNWWPDGVMITHAGTATGGSTTTLTDSTKATSYFWTQTDRGRWAGFVVEVEVEEDVWERRPITVHAGDETIGWEEPLSQTASGKAYRIREPKFELNRWQERTLRLFFPPESGSERVIVEVPILFSDDIGVYFDELPDGKVITAGTVYQIIEPQPGTCWKWSIPEGESEPRWVKPTGVDDRSGTDGVEWPDDTRAALPTTVGWYGNARKGDYTTAELHESMEDTINEMVWLAVNPNWTSRHDPDVAELNFRFGGANVAEFDGALTPAQGWAQVLDLYHAYDGSQDTEQDGETPYVFVNTYDQYSDAANHLDLSGEHIGVWGYGRITNATTLVASAIDWLVYSTIDEFDSDESHFVDSNYGLAAFANPVTYEEDLEFNAYGSDVLWRKWSIYSSDDPAQTALRVSPDAIGKVEPLPDFKEPSLLGTDDVWDNETTGWYAKDKIAILKFDVPGGIPFIKAGTS